MRKHGRNGRVLISTDGLAWSAITAETWSVNREPDRQPVPAMGDSNLQYVFGLPDLQGQFAGPFDSDDPQTFIDADGETPVYLNIYPDFADQSVYAQGRAFLVLSVQGGARAPITYSANFVAASDWDLELGGST